MVDDNERAIVPKDQPSMLVISEEVVDTYMQTSQMLTSKFKEWLIPEVDFTTEIFGRGRKPTLLDPGAGKLIGFFACRPRHRILERFYDKDEEGYESIRYAIATEIIQASTGKVVAEGVGSCSSDEKKYKYRWYFSSELQRMGMSKDEIHALPEREIQTQTRGKVKQYRIRNPEIPDLDNTILKMASKRSEVDGCLQLPGVAAVFTQDVGDYKTPEVQPKDVKSEQVPVEEKPADSDRVREIREQAKRDREKKTTPPPQEKPTQTGVSSIEELEEIMGRQVDKMDEHISVTQDLHGFTVEPNRTLDQEIVEVISYIVEGLGGKYREHLTGIGYSWLVPYKQTE